VDLIKVEHKQVLPLLQSHEKPLVALEVEQLVQRESLQEETSVPVDRLQEEPMFHVVV
jgi:hypothetical protein